MPNTFIEIAAVTVGVGGASTIDFTSIPSTYTDLLLVSSTRLTTATADCLMVFNNVTATTNYSSKVFYGNGSVSGSFSSPTSQWYLGGWANSSSQTANTFSNSQTYISNYTSSTNKSISTESVTENNATGASVTIAMLSGIWSDTAAINRITLSPNSGNFVQYSTATLYGIKNS
jgi:hypothetical protein